VIILALLSLHEKLKEFEMSAPICIPQNYDILEVEIIFKYGSSRKSKYVPEW
jgi:hypothetical protein